MLKRTLLAAMMLSALGSVPQIANSQVTVRIAPPEPRYERVLYRAVRPTR